MRKSSYNFISREYYSIRLTLTKGLIFKRIMAADPKTFTLTVVAKLVTKNYHC